MRSIVLMAMMAATLTACAENGDSKMAMDKNMSHVHIQHVSKSWGDTPKKMGLMDTAIAEAKVAAQHAVAAAKKTDDLAWMKMHTKHVIHAVDASKIEKGPGLGYGVIKASQGVAKHIRLAAGSSGSSAFLQQHAVHVAASAENSVQRGNQIIELSAELLATNDTATAAKLMQQISTLSQQLLDGADVNGDGKVTWHPGEGGLQESQKHLGLISQHEGL